jgi:cytochrome c-type biogenesis protein CcmH
MAAAAITTGVVVIRGGDANSPPPTSSTAPNDPLAALEARTKQNPKDAEAWSALATGYFESGRFDEAISAYGSALELAPQNAALWSARGEARTMADPRDPMPAAAVADFEAALKRDPKDPRARYFLAVRQDLAGDHEGAINSWLALLADTPPGAVWEADLRRTIEQVGKINKIDVAQRLAAVRQPAQLGPMAPRTMPGPSAEDLARASSIRPAEQREMAEGMVARLEGRLASDPANIDGWIMLIRSRMSLGQPDRARAALAAAIKANPAQASMLREQAAAMGVK